MPIKLEKLVKIWSSGTVINIFNIMPSNEHLTSYNDFFFLFLQKQIWAELSPGTRCLTKFCTYVSRAQCYEKHEPLEEQKFVYQTNYRSSIKGKVKRRLRLCWANSQYEEKLTMH